MFLKRSLTASRLQFSFSLKHLIEVFECSLEMHESLMAFSLLVVLVVAFVGRWFVALKTLLKVEILIEKNECFLKRNPTDLKKTYFGRKKF